MKLFLIRHGETDWNVQNRFQGRENIPLNENGIRQAVYCGNALQIEHFAAIISSPLDRAVKTAQIIARCAKIHKLFIDNGLIERDFAQISGMNYDEREAFYAAGHKDDRESCEDVLKRMMACINKYAEMFYDENIIMISHGAAIRTVINEFTNGVISSNNIILKNTCISILEYENGNIHMGPYNMSPDEYKTREMNGEYI